MGRPRKNPPTITNHCPTCDKDFVIKYVKKHQVYCSKTCAQHSPSVRALSLKNQKLTYLEKYGVEHPMQTVTVKNNFKQSMLEKYGVEHPSHMTDFNEKVKSTLKEKYGSENYNNIEQIKQTMLERYGVDNIQKLKHINEKTSNTKLKNHYDFIVQYCNENKLQFLCNWEEYNGYHFSNDYIVKCHVCNRNSEITIYNLNNIFCRYCHPEQTNNIENNFDKFLQQILPNNTIIIKNDRTVLNGKELDFHIPSKKYAFELDGIYWHSEENGKTNKHYHLNKTKSCAFHGLNLVHIFDCEWRNKQEIIKSIIRNLLNSTEGTKKYNARDCEIREVLNAEKNKFLNENHLQGEDKSTIKIGLYQNNVLLSLMTFRKTSRFDNKSEWELTRFCNKINTRINGGASKLFTYFLEEYMPKTIVSYCDRRLFDGNLYKKLGFNFVGFTSPGYYYIINKYKDIRHRMSFQKHKLSKLLPTFNEKLSEWENMKLAGYDRIWDCGNSKWIFINKV